jgi:hypothetical protein
VAQQIQRKNVSSYVTWLHNLESSGDYFCVLVIVSGYQAVAYPGIVFGKGGAQLNLKFNIILTTDTQLSSHHLQNIL